MDKEYINGFLNYLTSIYNYNKTNNPDFVMEPNMVYTLLITYGIVGAKESIEPLFNIWIDRFKERPGIKVFRTMFFLQCFLILWKETIDNIPVEFSLLMMACLMVGCLVTLIYCRRRFYP